MMTSPSTSKKTPSQRRMNGILSVGLSSRVRFQSAVLSDISVITNSTDLGMTGVQVRRLRLPLLNTAIENSSMKLFDLPIPMKVNGVCRPWNAF